MDWILDFDDTLAMGPNTWAFQEILPSFIAQHQLTYNETIFDSVTLQAQQRGNEGADEAEVLDFIFGTFGWPDHLKPEFVDRIFNEYTPHLFPDTIPFLERMKAASDRLFIISNNNHVPALVEMLGIAGYFTGIYTPKICGGAAPKPQITMWDHFIHEQQVESLGHVKMIGDDPWSDGTFAQRAKIDCWIIDRLARYTTLHTKYSYHWIKSLVDVEKG